MLERVIVNVDGGARGNPGPAAIAAVASDPDGGVLAERSRAIGEATNNVAEYRAMLELELPARLREKVTWAIEQLSKPAPASARVP